MAVSQIFSHRLGRRCIAGGVSHYSDNYQQHGNRGALLPPSANINLSTSNNLYTYSIHTYPSVLVFFLVVQIGCGTYAAQLLFTSLIVS